MTSRDYAFWKAWFSEPRGEERLDWLFAALLARLVQVNGKDRDPKEDLIKFIKTESKPEQSQQTVEQQKEVIGMIASAFGVKVE